MKRRVNFRFVSVLLVLALLSGATWVWQWQQTLVLRHSLESAQTDANELTLLQAENLRLRARQVPAAELERLRADHAALPRLRAELEALKRTP